MITKDLGAVSAYAYAVEKGYTGTEEEFAALMASYASVAEEAAESAESAQASATTANSAASTATNKASEATTAAQTATAKAEEAQADADAAALDASQALSAASTATSKASEAAQSASDAVTAKTAAQTAQTAAEGSATTAQTAAQTATQKAAEAAESARTLTIDTTLSQSGQAADAKVVGDRIDDLRDTIATSGNDINKSDLQTGYYYKRVASTTTVELAENASSVYLPLLDVSNYIGGKLKIKVSSIKTGSARMFGFCDDEYVTSSLYAESTAGFIEVDDGYEIEIPITDNYFFFSFSSSAVKIHISYYSLLSYSKGYIDTVLSEEEAKITTLNKVTGIDSDNNYPLTVTRLDLGATGNRVRTPIFDRKKYWKSVTVATMVSDFQCNIFVNDSAPVIGWVNGINRYEFADNVERFYVAFRHSDNASISVTDIDTILQNLTVTIEYDVLSSKKVAYVSTTGSDDYSGTAISPYATVNKALQAGANVILLTAGEYIQTIDLANTTESTIELRNITFNGKVIFKPSLSILATAETLVNGYSRVYSSPTANFVSDNIKWLWQNGVADIRTEISDSERHPAQRGQTYRLDDTKIVKCSSTTLSDALSEIEDATDTYKWFFDSTNLVLYFSRPEPVTSEHSICGDVSNTLLFSNLNRDKSIKAYGIETKYMAFNVTDLTNPELYDCKASNVCSAGGFRYDRSISAKFTRCEACSVESGLNGDGFNAHSIKNGDPFAKQTTVSLVDCWSHDNQDDGYSDHERSETVVRGGLYEYNGKAGITPSFGSHCSIYDVMSRKNYNGFYLIGAAAADEGGKYSQVVCYNCVSIENTRNGNYGRGFVVDGTGNKMILINCKSIDDTIGYLAGTGSSIELIDCGASGNTTVKSGNITVKNTTVVS